MTRNATTDDAEAIAAIYNHYVATTAITFEEEAVTAGEMAHRIESYTKDLPWLVFEDEGRVLGYAYATPWKARAAYRHSVEVTVYVEKAHGGRGIGTALYRELIPRLREKGVHALVAGIALPNPGSQTLHESFGFERLGRFREVGRKFGRWIDVGYWELVLQACPLEPE